MPYDAIVIGSGFGGAITACRLAEAGMKVLVLERGRRWGPRDTPFPRKAEDPWLWSHSHPEVHNGWLDLRRYPGMTVAQGAGVGGGSLIYANISCEAPLAFDSGWPEQITYAMLKPHYDTVGAVMNVQPVPDNQWTRRMFLMKEAAENAGFADRFRPLDLAVTFNPDWTYAKDFGKDLKTIPLTPNAHGAMQGYCAHLGNCDIGCDVLAKNTLDLNYLYLAENKYRACIRPLHLVETIERLDKGDYRVSFDELTPGGRVPGSETARIVIVAAGSLGSTELLLRARDIHGTLPRIGGYLGRRWSGNGDFLTPAFYTDREVDADRGPTIASAIDFHDGSENGQSFWIQDGGIPNLAVSYLLQKIDDPATDLKAKVLLTGIRDWLRQVDPLRAVMPWFAQGVDAGDGTLSLTPKTLFSPGGALHLSWDGTKSKALIDTIIDMHKLLSKETGGTAFVPPTWTLFHELITPHPLGGCNMGTAAENGVVDHRGEVFGYPNLYVADGAIIPRPLGVNPSRTIGALAEHIAAGIVAGRG